MSMPIPTLSPAELESMGVGTESEFTKVPRSPICVHVPAILCCPLLT